MIVVGGSSISSDHRQSSIVIGHRRRRPSREISIWREEIQNRNRLLDFGGKKFKIEIDSSIWREEIQNRNRLLDFGGKKFNTRDDIRLEISALEIESAGKIERSSTACKPLPREGRADVVSRRRLLNCFRVNELVCDFRVVS
jgi:hypothetical protein